MGAIYALFAALFYWIGKITGFQFYEKWGVIHFYLFTIAVNIVFFPMHALGMAGMPRRIPDYADCYLNWNLFMTIGVFLTIISLFILAKLTINLNKHQLAMKIIFKKCGSKIQLVTGCIVS